MFDPNSSKGEKMPLAVLLFLLLFPSKASPLTWGELKDWALSLPVQPIPSETTAVGEFRRLYQEATGSRITEGVGAPTMGRILFQPIPNSEAGTNGESFRIRIERDRITLEGSRPRGLLYAVYELFERFGGVRFLTHDHTYFPDPFSEIELPEGTYEKDPDFLYRNAYYGENFAHPDFSVRLRLNTFNQDPAWGGICKQSLINHSFDRQIPVSQYGSEHPEYFAWIDGKRVLEAYSGPEPCVTHPDVIDIVYRAVDKELKSRPESMNISVSQNDNDQYCRCPECAKVIEREGSPMGPQLELVNEIARRMQVDHPGKKVGTLSYWYTRKPPTQLKPEGNVQIQLCSIECCTLHAIDDPNCGRNRNFCDDLAGWKAICKDIWIWHYNVNFRAYDLPLPNLKVIGKNTAFFRNNHVGGIFMQAAYNTQAGEFSDLRNYVIARCLWEPRLDSWELTREFCELHYGPAAEKIMEALGLIHDQAEVTGKHPGCFPSEKDLSLTAGMAARFWELLNAAEDRVEDHPEYQSRVRKISLAGYRSILSQPNPMALKSGVPTELTRDEIRQFIDTYESRARKFGLIRPNENTPQDQYFSNLRNRFKSLSEN